jgi:hypothetical protein
MGIGYLGKGVGGGGTERKPDRGNAKESYIHAVSPY